MSDRQNNSSAAISRFVADHDLANNYNVVDYKGTVRFEHGRSQEEKFVANIQITRDGAEFRVKLLEGIPDKFPYRFSARFDEIEYKPYGPLTISGNYIHSGLGRYVVHIYHQII